MKTHWSAHQQRDAKKNGVSISMSVHYLYNEDGLYLGYVQKLSWGEWRAYAGRPAVQIGDYPSLEEAKKAVEGTLKE